MYIIIGDITAIEDVINELAEQTEQMSVEENLRMCDALDALSKKIATTRSLCETAAKKLMDGQPAQVDNKVYVEKTTGKWRPDQNKIRRHVATRSVCDANGEMMSPHDAAQRAVDLMYALFVSPSQMPKQAGMKQLGLDAPDVAEWERTGSTLKVVEV